tara:strand:+ start:1040 stop:1222 length:183 start_codon:yes stop_codon:yes gene_type:complete
MKTGIFYRSILTRKIKHISCENDAANINFVQDQENAKVEILRETDDSASGAVLALIDCRN